MTKKKSEKKVVEEVKVDIPPEEITREQTEDSPQQICGIKISGAEEMICYLQKDDQGGRYIITNPANIKYVPTEGKQGQFKIAFVPQSPASKGILFVPYGQLEYIYDPKEDLVKEWLGKFTHTQSTEMKTKPKFTG